MTALTLVTKSVKFGDGTTGLGQFATDGTNFWPVHLLANEQGTLITDSAGLAVTAGAGSAIIGSILGRTAAPSVTPAVTASSAYAANNVVGGVLNFANAAGAAFSGILQGAKLAFRSVQTVGFNLYLFNANPTASTFTDKGAPVLAAADVPKLIDVIPFSTGYSGLGTHTLYPSDGLGISFLSGSTSLYGVLVTTGTPTFASSGDLTVMLNTLPD